MLAFDVKRLLRQKEQNRPARPATAGQRQLDLAVDHRTRWVQKTRSLLGPIFPNATKEESGTWDESKQLRHPAGSSQGGEFRPKNTDPATMLASAINKELDRLSSESSKLNAEFIAAGRGSEKPSEYLRKDDPLAMRARQLFTRETELQTEIVMRAGPGQRRLPIERGRFGPRKRVEKYEFSDMFRSADHQAEQAMMHPKPSPQFRKFFARWAQPLPEKTVPQRMDPSFPSASGARLTLTTLGIRL